MFSNQKIYNKPAQKIGLSLLCVLSLSFLSFGDIRFSEVSQQFQVRGYTYFGGHGISWADVNRDGRVDIFIKNEAAQGIHAVADILYINYGSYFSDEASQRGAADAYADGTHGAVFADFDNDGNFDLFASTTYNGVTPAFNHLYRNNGNGFFQDITSGIIPPQTTSITTRGVAAADFDKDGDIDFYFSNALPDPDPSNPAPSPPQSLPNFYINNGDGTFTAMYRGIDWTGFTQGVVAADIDNDGDMDIAEAKWGPPSTIYLNDGQGYFTDAGRRLGLSQALGEQDNGIAFADLDKDGDLDMAIISGRRVALWRNTGSSFYRYQAIWLSGKGGFHLSFGDFDHDGDLELYLSGENVYENDGEGHFTQVPAPDAGLSASLSSVDPRACALGDFDNDGDLDICVTDKKSYNLLFRNEINNSDWIQVEIISDHSGAAGGVGTKIDLYAAGHLGESAYLKGHREIMGEYGYLGQDMPIAHFGASLAGGATYDLKVTFLNGEERIFRDLAPGQKIQVAYILPPLNFSGKKIENKALFYRETLIELEWEPNPLNKDVQKYRLYEVDQGQALLAELPANSFKYTIRNVDKSKPYRFAITALDTNSSESPPVYATVDGAASKTESLRQGLQREIKGKI